MAKKRSRIIFCVTKEQHEDIKKTAETLGLSIGAYLRALHAGAKRAGAVSLEIQERMVSVPGKEV